MNYEYEHGDSWENHIVFMDVEVEWLCTAMIGTVERDSALCFGGEVSDLLCPCRVSFLLMVG
jgi:hypothetical protein